MWGHEIGLWRPDLTFAVAAGSKKDRLRALALDRDIIIIGRDNIRDVLDVPRDKPFRTIVIDELSGFKSRASVRWRAARKIVREKSVKSVWGLSGTPTPNGLIDLWAQIALIDGGERLGKNLTTYRSRYFSPGRRLPSGVITEWIPREEAQENVQNLLEDICLSMDTIGRVDIPPLTYNVIEIDLPSYPMSVYKELKRDLVVNLDMIGGSIHSAPTAAALSNRLSQVSAGFIYSDDDGQRHRTYDLIHSEKTRAVQEVIEGTGSPVLVLYRFIAEKEMLLEALGSMAHAATDPGVLEAWNTGTIPVMLAHPASIGHGLNLQFGGHTAVWTTLPWSLEEWEQTNRRLARQGQKYPVVIHIIQARRTLDLSIGLSLEGKASIQDALLAHLESPI